MKTSKNPGISTFFEPFLPRYVKMPLKNQKRSEDPKNTKRKNLDFSRFFTGAPRGIRTHDLLIRSQTLYPAELGAQGCLSDSLLIIAEVQRKCKPFFEKN